VSDLERTDDPVLEDPLEAMRARGKNPELAAVLAWAIPGAGHFYAGHPAKGGGALVFLLGLFVWGLFLSGGEAVSLDNTVGHPYAFLAQAGAGSPTAVGLIYSHRVLKRPVRAEDRAGPEYSRGHPDRDTGLLFTMIAGLLNLLLIHDCLCGVPGGLQRRKEETLREKRLAELRAEVLAERAAKADPPAEAEPATAPTEQPEGPEASS
jgi:hypothetical protein